MPNNCASPDSQDNCLLTERAELYSKVIEGLDDVKSGRVKPLSEAIEELRKRRVKAD